MTLQFDRDHSGIEASHTVAHRFSQLVGAGLHFYPRGILLLR